MFLYYVPRDGSKPYAFPKSISYAFESKVKVSRVEVTQGPGGNGPGWLIQPNTNEVSRLRLDIDAQKWQPIYAPGIETAEGARLALWVGCYKDDALEAAKLARAQQFQGHSVELGDGSKWLAAIARGVDLATGFAYSPLPKTLTYDPTSNKWRPWKVLPQFERFLQLCNEYIEADDDARKNEKTSFDFECIDEFAILALTANYRIGQSELSLFDGVYTVEVRRALIDAALDMPTLIEWFQTRQKKSDQPAAATSPI